MKLSKKQIAERVKYITERRKLKSGERKPTPYKVIAPELNLKLRQLYEFMAKYMGGG